MNERVKMELSKLQQSIINAPCNRSVVISSAASGKTKILTEKVRQILRAGVNPRDIAVITFTNMAAAELRQRLGDDYKEGLFVGTVHALANYMLCMGGVSTKKVLNEEKFDELFELIKENPSCVRHLEWILLDEAQDSDKSQFQFLFEMIKPDCFFVVGDPKQMIYSFRGSDSTLMMRLGNTPGARIFDMNENYRNGKEILGFAKRLIRPTGLIDTSIPMCNYLGEVEEIPYNSSTILQLVKEGQYGDWAILTRTNQEIADIGTLLKKEKIPFDTFKQGDLSKDELNTKMNQNTVKVLTVHSAKGLEFLNVIVVGARYYNAEERNVCYVAATRAKNRLIWMGTSKKRK